MWLLKIGLCPKNKSHPLGGWIFTLKSEFIVFVETIKDSVTGSFKISKAVGIYNKFLQNSVLRFNVTVIYAPAINRCK